MLGKTFKITAALAAMLLWSLPAQALEVEEAGVEKGEAELVYEGTYTDDNGEGVYEHEHEIEAELGITDWLKLAIGIGFEEEEGERDFDFTEIEAAATIEIIDPEQGGTGLALFTSLSKEFAPDEEEDDEENVTTFAIGAIAEQHFNKWLVRANLFYVTDVDSDEDENKFDGIEYAYRISYEVTENIGLGVEGYGASISPDEGDDEDTHMVGPVIYYERELGNRHESHSVKDDDDGDDDEEGMEFEAQLGVLFGTNDETADVTFKWNLGLEF